MKKLAIFSPVLLLAGCGATNNVTTPQTTVITPECVFADAPEKAAPLWVCDVPIEGYALSAVGFSEKKPSQAMTTAAATTQARAKMSEHFATTVSQLFTDYQKSLETQEESKFIIDTDLVRETVSSMTLFGSKVIRTLTSPTQGQYVVIALDESTYKANAEKVFAALVDENAEMKQLFDSEQARERLLSMIKVQ